MEAKFYWLNSLVNKNKSDFANFTNINWLNYYDAIAYQEKRDNLLAKINTLLFKNTKPYYHQISNGCKICGAGKWSCLFITNECNANCFYCPTSQNEDTLPSTQGLDFNDPLVYANYVNAFGFKGVSFSGGEPLLHFDKTLAYLKAVREHCAPDLYVWMYTNGILASEKYFQELAKNGLNEIRFDIGATGYQLSKVKLAKGIIPNVTIEIPAVPEELDKLKQLLPEIIDAGVTNLNLHQLRLTPHNAEKLISKGYTIVNAERPIVLESELAALELINFAQENELKIGINYCSFHFKNRFQKAGFRKMVAQKLYPNCEITENGFIREFTNDSISYKTVQITNNLDLESFFPNKIEELGIFYKQQIIFKKEGLTPEMQSAIKSVILNQPIDAPTEQWLFEIWQHECIESDLREY